MGDFRPVMELYSVDYRQGTASFRRRAVRMAGAASNLGRSSTQVWLLPRVDDGECIFCC